MHDLRVQIPNFIIQYLNGGKTQFLFKKFTQLRRVDQRHGQTSLHVPSPNQGSGVGVDE